MGARKTLEFVANHHDQIHFLNLALFNMPMAEQETSTVESKDFTKEISRFMLILIIPRVGAEKKSGNSWTRNSRGILRLLRF